MSKMFKIFVTSLLVASLIAAPSLLEFASVAAQNTTSTNDGRTTNTTNLENFQGVYANLDKPNVNQYKCATGEKYVPITGFSLSATRESQTSPDWQGSFSIHGKGGGVKSGDISSGTASNSQFSLSGTIDKDNLCAMGLESENATSIDTLDLSQVGAIMTISTPSNGCPGDVVDLKTGQTTNKFSQVTVHCEHSD